MSEIETREGVDLLPCPFCGGKAKTGTYKTESLWSHNEVTYTTVGCDCCDIQFSSEPGYELEAPAAWNRRTLPASQADSEGVELHDFRLSGAERGVARCVKCQMTLMVASALGLDCSGDAAPVSVECPTLTSGPLTGADVKEAIMGIYPQTPSYGAVAARLNAALSTLPAPTISQDVPAPAAVTAEMVDYALLGLIDADAWLDTEEIAARLSAALQGADNHE